jgi:hypothetical protein
VCVSQAADLIADPISIADLVADEYADPISGSRFPMHEFPSRALLPLGVLICLFRGTHRYPQGTGGVLRCAVGVREGHCRGTRGVLEGYSGVLEGYSMRVLWGILTDTNRNLWVQGVLTGTHGYSRILQGYHRVLHGHRRGTRGALNRALSGTALALAGYSRGAQ